MSDEQLDGESDELLEILEETETDEDVPERVRPTATLDQLKKKQRVTKTVYLVLNGDDGEPVEVGLSFRGIPAHEYDKTISKYPPRPSDKKQGYGYNPDKFGPALLSLTCIDPVMSEEDANEIWASDDWNRGERMMLLMAAIEVCTAGLNVPFKKRD
jgi:hypothetical protein